MAVTSFLQVCCKCSSSSSRPALWTLLTCRSCAQVVSNNFSLTCCFCCFPALSSWLIFLCVTACIKDVLIEWPWWRGLAMSVTVSGLALRGKTRSLPQVSTTLCWTSGRHCIGMHKLSCPDALFTAKLHLPHQMTGSACMSELQRATGFSSRCCCYGTTEGSKGNHSCKAEGSRRHLVGTQRDMENR